MLWKGMKGKPAGCVSNTLQIVAVWMGHCLQASTAVQLAQLKFQPAKAPVYAVTDPACSVAQIGLTGGARLRAQA